MIKRPYILGIDPGFSGALCVLDYENEVIHDLIDMPVKTVKDSKQIDLEALSIFIDSHSKLINLAVIEHVGVMTGKEGRVSMFNFGEGVGILKGIIASHYIPTFQVRPQIWKSILGLTRDKNVSIDKANKIFPNTDYFKLKKHDGRAEAALLADFGKRFLKVV